MAVTDSLKVSFEKIWFLDVYGHVLCHSPYRNGLNRVPFLGMLLKGFVALPYPLPTSSLPTWWAHPAIPLEMPELLLKTTDNDLVTLQRKDTGEYLSINVQNNQILDVGAAGGWEHFLPITHDMFQGLILLTDPSIGKVVPTATGQAIRQIIFPPPGSPETHTALLAEQRIDLVKCRSALAAMGRLAVEETATFALPLHAGEGCCDVSVTRLKPLAEEG